MTQAVTQHLGIQEQLQRLHGRYDRLIRAVEQTADAVMITNRQGVIEYVNPGFEETTGYAADEAPVRILHYSPGDVLTAVLMRRTDSDDAGQSRKERDAV